MLEDVTKLSSTESSEDVLQQPNLSRAGEARLKNANPFLKSIIARLGDVYGPDNPNGLVNLGVAENSLMHEWLSEYFEKGFKMSYDDLGYQTFNGSTQLLESLCTLFSNYFNPLIQVKPEHVLVGTGLSSVLDQLSSMLGDPGDGVMLATPFYNGFNTDLALRSQLFPIGVDIPIGVDPTSPKTLESFEAKYHSTVKNKGPTPKAVILCNPHNPLGFCYQRETIIEYMKFCEKYNLHLISDEIYALSIFNPKQPRQPSEVSSNVVTVKRHDFVSVLSIDAKKEAQCNPARIHLLYGMSKDFCANGLRVGVLVSAHNKRLLDSLFESTILMKTSNPSNNFWNKLLRDEKALPWFINENQRRMAEAYDYVVEFFDTRSIPYYPSYSGHFIFIDLRKYLPSQGEGQGPELEMKLFLQMLNNHNIYIAPGLFYQNPVAGWFRFTFVVRRDYLNVGLERLGQLLDKLDGKSNQTQIKL